MCFKHLALVSLLIFCLPSLCRLFPAEQAKNSHPDPVSPTTAPNNQSTTKLTTIPPPLRKTTELPPLTPLESGTLPPTPPASPCLPSADPSGPCTLSAEHCEDLYPVSAPCQVLLRYETNTSLLLNLFMFRSFYHFNLKF